MSERGKGQVYAVWEVHCGRCERFVGGLPRDYAGELRGMGWRNLVATGWTCPDCCSDMRTTKMQREDGSFITIGDLRP